MGFARSSRKCFKMKKLYYDFHIHSCLSPCADDDMTPNNIAGMAKIKGLDIVALTDHNTCGNCRSFIAAAEKQEIIGIAGMELTTAEDIHIVCLFEELDEAMSFDSEVDTHRCLIKNRTDIFGDQFITDGDDNIVGTDEYLLSNATDLTIEDAAELVKKHNGVCFPAHIDRESNGVVAILGSFPDEPYFKCAEFHDTDKQTEYTEKYTNLKDKVLLTSSDAHYLWDIRDKEAYFELEDEPYSSVFVRHKLFEKLR